MEEQGPRLGSCGVGGEEANLKSIELSLEDSRRTRWNQEGVNSVLCYNFYTQAGRGRLWGIWQRLWVVGRG